MIGKKIIVVRPRLSLDFAIVLRMRDMDNLGWSRMAKAYREIAGSYDVSIQWLPIPQLRYLRSVNLVKSNDQIGQKISQITKWSDEFPFFSNKK